MFGDLDWPLNGMRRAGVSASAELVKTLAVRLGTE